VHVLLDENLPVGLAAELPGHSVETVVGLGWSGIKNGELLRRAADRFEALVTMDSNLEFQQPLAEQPFGVVVVRAASNRIQDLLPLIPDILAALNALAPGEVRTAGG
jgi:predicted nuclease of predicted toxin-antitoxin system